LIKHCELEFNYIKESSTSTGITEFI